MAKRRVVIRRRRVGVEVFRGPIREGLGPWLQRETNKDRIARGEVPFPGPRPRSVKIKKR